MERSKKRQWNKEDVRALRQHLKLTQVKLSEELGTRQQTISEWEKGMYRPRGASATLLSIIAERSGFDYEAVRGDKKTNYVAGYDKVRKLERNQELVIYSKNHPELGQREIGQKFGITRQRVHQILKSEKRREK